MSKKPKRPRDTNQLAKRIVDIATGEADDKPINDGKNPAAVALGRLGGKKGGKARADSLTGKERKDIASRAAAARWGKVQIGEAIKEGVINIGGAEIPCYILSDETRVLARSAFVKAIGRKGKVKGGRSFDGELQTPVFLTADNLKPFLNNEINRNSKPIIFKWKGTEIIGYKAELLPDVCDVFSDAERAGKLRQNRIIKFITFF